MTSTTWSSVRRECPPSTLRTRCQDLNRGLTFMVNGRRQPYVRNTRFEARRAVKLLSAATGPSVVAVGVIVPVGAADIRVKDLPSDVKTLNRMRTRALARVLAARSSARAYRRSLQRSTPVHDVAARQVTPIAEARAGAEPPDSWRSDWAAATGGRRDASSRPTEVVVPLDD